MRITGVHEDNEGDKYGNSPEYRGKIYFDEVQHLGKIFRIGDEEYKFSPKGSYCELYNTDDYCDCNDCKSCGFVRIEREEGITFWAEAGNVCCDDGECEYTSNTNVGELCDLFAHKICKLSSCEKTGECHLSILCGQTVTQEQIRSIESELREEKIETPKNKTQEVTKMNNNKIGLSYDNRLVIITARGALATSNGSIENLGNMFINTKTVEMDTIKDNILPNDILMVSGTPMVVKSTAPFVLIDPEKQTTTELIEEKGVGGIPTYKKVVNPLSLSNPSVGMALMMEGNNLDPVQQMAMLNMMQQKNAGSNDNKIDRLCDTIEKLLVALVDKGV